MVNLTYVLPVRASRAAELELDGHLTWLSARVELIVVDGSGDAVFAAHARRWSSLNLHHIRVDPDLRPLLNGKVAGVLTGVRRASHPYVVIADDDVRYDADGLRGMIAELGHADVVRPQNYFDPLPWHAWLDTGRTLLNRMTGGDWPGTIGVRRSALDTTGGYDGDVMFENLELVRTIAAAGGRASCPLGLYVRRLPPASAHFWSQRVRQAYDEFARPLRLALWMAILPTVAALVLLRRWSWLAAAAAAAAAIAEAGRRRQNGARVFPAVASLAAPLWVCERAVCAWLAAGARVIMGGIPYRGRIVARAATPVRVLHARQAPRGV
jgi:hypothetical protein